MSISLWPRGLQHSRLPFPALHYLWSLLKFMSIELVMLSNHLILCHALPLLHSIFLSIKIFSDESAMTLYLWWLFSHSVVSDSAALSFTISQSLLKLICIESVMPSNHLVLCYPFLLLPSICPSNRVFSNESLTFIWLCITNYKCE